MGSSGLAAAILDFRLPVTSDGVCNSAIVFLDPENMGVAVGIILLSCLQAKICLGVVSPPPVHGARCFFSVHGTKVNTPQFSSTRDRVSPNSYYLLVKFQLLVALEVKLLSSASYFAQRNISDSKLSLNTASTA